MNKNCSNLRTSNDVDIRLGPVTNLDKKEQGKINKFDDVVMSANSDVSVIFRIYGQFEAIQKPDSRRMVCKTYIFSNSNLLSYKSWKQN